MERNTKLTSGSNSHDDGGVWGRLNLDNRAFWRTYFDSSKHANTVAAFSRRFVVIGCAFHYFHRSSKSGIESIEFERDYQATFHELLGCESLDMSLEKLLEEIRE